MACITMHSVPNATLVYPTQFPNGGSSPRVCDFDDMVLRLVKWHPSPHGLTASYSELIASRLGQLIEAPICRASLVCVDPELLPNELRTNIKQNFHVGFTYSPGKNFSAADYAGIQNEAALPAAAVLLTWLLVGDQQGHNQYLFQLERVLPDKSTEKMNHFLLIDQAMICGNFNWTSLELNQPNLPYELPVHLKERLTFSSVEPILNLLPGLTEDDICHCLSSYPEEWEIGEKHVKKLTDFLLARRTYLVELLRTSLPD